MNDPYQVLGVRPGCSEEEIRQRYLTLVRQHPPERDPQQFAAIRQAYEKLRDPVERLKGELFVTETEDSIDAVMNDLYGRLSGVRLPVDKLLSLAGRP